MPLDDTLASREPIDCWRKFASSTGQLGAYNRSRGRTLVLSRRDYHTWYHIGPLGGCVEKCAQLLSANRWSRLIYLMLASPLKLAINFIY